MFTLETLTNHLIAHPSYLEKGVPSVAKTLGVTEEMVLEAKSNAKTLQSEGWEVKAKWIKNKEQSTFLVNKGKQEDYKTAFKEFLESYFPPNEGDIPVYQESSSALLVYMSDKHIGAKTKENSLFDNNYDAKEFERRMILLAKEIINLNESRKFDQIILIDLLDTIDGFDGKTTRGGHSLSQNMTNREVYTVFMDVHLKLLHTVQNECKCPISYITAGESNHGGDFEWVCNKSLETVVSLKYPNIEFYVGDKFIEHFEIANHCFILCHGKDAEDMKYPLPSVLDQKTELYFKRYIDAKGINSKYIHVIKGDQHQASCQYGEFFRYKNVLSMYGSSKWSMTNFMQNTKGVCMDILNEGKIEEHYLFFN